LATAASACSLSVAFKIDWVDCAATATNISVASRQHPAATKASW